MALYVKADLHLKLKLVGLEVLVVAEVRALHRVHELDGLLLVLLRLVVDDLCGNQPVSRAHDNSSLSHFSAMTRPTWLGRAARNRHRHAMSRRRVDGVEDDAMIQHERAVKF